MAFSLNRVTLIGQLGRDPETRFVSDTSSVTNFSVATQNSYKDKSGNWVNDTTWHNVVAWNLSEFIKGNLHKGSKVYIEGRIFNSEYTDKNGDTKRKSEIISTNIIPLDAKKNDAHQEDEKEDNTDLPF